MFKKMEKERERRGLEEEEEEKKREKKSISNEKLDLSGTQQRRSETVRRQTAV